MAENLQSVSIYLKDHLSYSNNKGSTNYIHWNKYYSFNKVVYNPNDSY